MVQYSDFDRVMEARYHFKNWAGLKSQISRVNFRFIQMFSNYAKVAAMIAITAICVAGTVHAQTEPNFQQIKQTSNGALIIVNGKEVGDLNSVPVESVESYFVLNAQSAIEMYGEKGKNGAVIIKLRQSLEEKAALLACECIKKLENPDDEKYKDCISNALLKAMENENSEELAKLNDFNVLKSTVSKVETLTYAILRSANTPENKGKTSSNAGYGSPRVKQELLNDQMFLITEYSTDETYGYSESNPIMVGGAKEKEGVQNETRFLRALAGPLGFPVTYKRVGSCCPFYTENGNIGEDGKGRGMLDVYEVIHDSLNEPVKLYINMYDSDVLKVPVGGFTLKK